MKLFRNFKGWQKAIIILMSVLACSSVVCVFAVGIFNIIPQTNAVASTSSPSPRAYNEIPTSKSTPPHRVSDVWDNGKGTNFALFIVANNSLTRQGAKTIIETYKNNYKGYKLINIFIFCDEIYATYQYMDDMDYHDPGDEIFKHIMYWYQTGEWSSSGVIFIFEPTVDYPTVGEACK